MTTNQALRFTGDIVASANDKRTYRYVTLPNELKCLLVCDPTTEKSAACCDVHVGSLSDPAEAQGLAHFLEHMLFMGTEKYPTENAYSAFLNTHGGSSNAYTSTENTVYYFDVLSDHFEGALDLFATFFTCPLFTESGVMREIQAVDSENSKNLQNDWWRKYQLMKSLSRPDHALNAFSTGNLHTLHEVPTANGTNIRDLMIAFYKKHHSANIMRLVVYGAADLDTMEGWVQDKFSAVTNTNLTRQAFPSDPFRAEQLQKIVEMVPVRDVKNVELLFPIPAVEDLYLTKPTKYFGHLIGHESDGSILSALKAKRWADGLSAYVETSARDFAAYVVRVDLTAEGVEHIPEIISAVFAYIGMIRRAGPMDWVWDELKGIADMGYRFLDKSHPSDYVVRLANNMQVHAPEHTLSGEYLLFQKDLSQAMQFLDYLKPENVLVMVAHKGFDKKTESTERWYGTPYTLREVAPAQSAAWKACMDGGSEWDSVLHFPQPNPFIPTDFSLHYDSKESAATVPALAAHHVIAGPGPLPMAQVVPFPKSHATAAAEPEDADDEEEEETEDDTAAVEATDSLIGADWLPILPGKKGLVWHKDDSEHRWDMPKTLVNVFLESSLAANQSAWHVSLTDVLADCLTEVLSEYSYYADCAGFSFSVSTSRGGLSVTAQGYTDKLPVLMERAFSAAYAICCPSAATPSPVNEALFQRVKEKVLRNYKNSLFMQPYYHCILANYCCLESPRWSYLEKYSALKDISINTFQMFANEWIRYLKVEVLVTGNSKAEEAVKMEQMVRDALHCKPLPSSMEAVTRGMDVFVPDVKEYIHRLTALSLNPAEVNSAVEALYLVGVGAGAGEGSAHWDGLLTEALLTLLVHMVSLILFVLCLPI